MKRLYVTISLDEIADDMYKFPSVDDSSFVPEELKYYCLISDRLPAEIHLKAEKSILYVCQRHYLFRIARDLGFEKVEATITLQNDQYDLIQKLVESKKLVIKELSTILEEDQNPEIWVWKSYFFHSKLDLRQKKLLKEVIQTFFSSYELISPQFKDVPKRVTDLKFDNNDTSVAFQSIMPISNSDWSRDYVNFTRKISSISPLKSINGQLYKHLFPQPDSLI